MRSKSPWSLRAAPVLRVLGLQVLEDREAATDGVDLHLVGGLAGRFFDVAQMRQPVGDVPNHPIYHEARDHKEEEEQCETKPELLRYGHPVQQTPLPPRRPASAPPEREDPSNLAAHASTTANVT